MALSSVDKLTSNNIKKTKSRILILDILHKESALLSAEDIFFLAKEVEPDISLSTVYRSLEMFVEHKLVKSMTLSEHNKLMYEEAHHKHMHHLICTKCNKVIHLEHCPVKSLQETIGENHDFTVTSHSLEFYGICKECRDH